MEIITIQEFRFYQDNLRNVMIMIAKVCVQYTDIRAHTHTQHCASHQTRLHVPAAASHVSY